MFKMSSYITLGLDGGLGVMIAGIEIAGYLRLFSILDVSCVEWVRSDFFDERSVLYCGF